MTGLSLGLGLGLDTPGAGGGATSFSRLNGETAGLSILGDSTGVKLSVKDPGTPANNRTNIDVNAVDTPFDNTMTTEYNSSRGKYALKIATPEDLTILLSALPAISGEFTIYIDCEMADVSTASQTIWSMKASTISDYVYLIQDGSDVFLRTRKASGSTYDTHVASVLRPTAGSRFESTVRVKDNLVALSVNGSTIANMQNTGALMPGSLTELRFGSFGGGNNSKMQSMLIYAFVLIPRAVSNFDLADWQYQRTDIDYTAYHAVIDAGQSNTNHGRYLDAMVDVFGGHTWQMDHTTAAISEANEPLLHVPQVADMIGHALPFCRDYYYPNIGAECLILPCGVGNTGFSDNRWNPNDDLHNRVESACGVLRRKCPNAVLKAILWQQGNRDMLALWSQATYAAAADAAFAAWRATLGSTIPIIVGGSPPAFVATDPTNYGPVAAAQADAPNRNSYCAYADPTGLTSGASGEYDAPDQRALGARYWAAFTSL